MPERVLFVCIHNSARSQMAEALLNREGGGLFIAESAGLQPGSLNPVVVEVLRERGIDIAGKRPRRVDEALRSGPPFDCVITVCDEGSAAGCPDVPGAKRKLHWSFPDPSALTGSRAQRLTGTRAICDQIQKRIEEWCTTFA
jgi:arsenate reductase (thioredoxin)